MRARSRTTASASERSGRPKQEFFQCCLSGRRCLTPAQLAKVARLLGIESMHLALREPLKNTPAQNEIIEKMVKRYSITYVPNRGVCLFDIVGFSLLSPFEQMMQLNSLSYSLNSAQSKLLTKRIGVDFSRTTTGDGFYIWNRDLTLEGNVNLYHFMQLALADNAIAHKKAQHNTVPRLRACFHVGSSYRVPPIRRAQPDALQLHRRRRDRRARAVIERALPGQILVGDFRDARCLTDRCAGRRSRSSSRRTSSSWRCATSSQLAGIELSGERVDAIRCYLDRHRSSRTASSRSANRRSTTNTGSRAAYTTPRSTSTATMPSRSCSASKIAFSTRSGLPGYGSEQVLRPAARLSAQRGVGERRLRHEQRLRRFVLVRNGAGTRATSREFRLRARKAHLVMPHGDQVAVAQPVLAHPPTVHETAVRAAEIDQHPAFRRLEEEVLDSGSRSGCRG